MRFFGFQLDQNDRIVGTGDVQASGILFDDLFEPETGWQTQIENNLNAAGWRQLTWLELNELSADRLADFYREFGCKFAFNKIECWYNEAQNEYAGIWWY